MSLLLSAGQREAMDMIGRFLDQNDHLVAVLTGFAGTGKTSLVRIIAENYGTPIVVTPTGKAALRVSEATDLDASTIHRFLYDVEDDPKTGEALFNLREIHAIRSIVGDSLVIVDEASMVDAKVWNDLRTMAQLADFRILLVGDTFQLPPVNKDKDGKPFCSLDYPTPFCVHMTEVVRQALDSPIIRASMLLREGKPEFMALNLLTPLSFSKLTDTVIRLQKEGGAVLVHRNATRHKINVNARAALGFDPRTVVQGEPLLVTQNNYPLEKYNGEITTFEGWDVPPGDRTTQAVKDNYSQSVIEMSFGVGQLDYGLCMISPDEISGRAEAEKISPWAIKKNSKVVYKKKLAYDEDSRPPPHLHANYGYCLTVHKSQGSEFPEILLVIERSLKAMPIKEQRRFLYTAITRAKAKVLFTYLEE